MKQDLFDRFFQKLTESAEFRREFVELAARHGIDFSGEMSEEELDAVSGGTGETWDDKLASVGDDAQLANIDLQNTLQQQQQTLQTLSSVSKMLHDTAMATIRKIG